MIAWAIARMFRTKIFLSTESLFFKQIKPLNNYKSAVFFINKPPFRYRLEVFKFISINKSKEFLIKY